MDFLKRIKGQLSRDCPHEAMYYSHNTNVAVNVKSLKYLIDDYERLDSELRSMKHNHNLDEQLQYVVSALYHTKGRSVDQILLTILNAIVPVLEDKERLSFFTSLATQFPDTQEDKQ